MTIRQFDERVLADDDKELNGVDLRNGAWEVAQTAEDMVRFRKELPGLGIEVSKTYRLAKAPAEHAPIRTIRPTTCCSTWR